MDIIDYINENHLGYKVKSLEDIYSNQKLFSLILAIRSLVDNTDDGKLAEACYKAAILMVNNVEEPYWKDIPKWKFWIDPKNDKWDSYFRGNHGTGLGDGSKIAINNLIHQWNKNKVVNIELFLRSLEVISREYARAFEPKTVKEIINSLMPLIELANQNLKIKQHK